MKKFQRQKRENKTVAKRLAKSEGSVKRLKRDLKARERKLENDENKIKFAGPLLKEMDKKEKLLKLREDSLERMSRSINTAQQQLQQVNFG